MDYSAATRANRLKAEGEAKAKLDVMGLAFRVADFEQGSPRNTAWRQLKRLERMGLIIKIRHGIWQKRI